MYFEDHIDSKARDLDIGATPAAQYDSSIPELFQNHNGRTTGKSQTRFLEEKEYNCAHKYVLSNCEILRPYEVLFENFIRQKHPQVSSMDIWKKFDDDFPKWFSQEVTLFENDLIKALAIGPSRKVTTWKRYSINGYNFRTFNAKTDIEKASTNNRVCISSTEGYDYYGTLNKVIELEYARSDALYKTVLFKCDWFDNSARGMNVHRDYKLVDVHRNRKYPIYYPFVLAYQVEQVYYAPYPSLKRDKEGWCAVFKVKGRSNIEAPLDDSVFQETLIFDEPQLSAPIVDTENELDVGNDGNEELEEDDVDEMSNFITDDNEEEEEEEEEDLFAEDHSSCSQNNDSDDNSDY